MALYLVSYDLDKPGQQDYPDLIARLEHLGARRILYSEWFLVNDATPKAIRDDLKRFMSPSDRILVAELKNNAAWDRLMITNEAVLDFYKNAT